MATPTSSHIGTATGNGPISPVILEGLANEQLANREAFQLAMKLAPLYGLPAINGTYPTWCGYRGLDLSKHPHTTPIGWGTGAMPKIQLHYGSADLRVLLYPVGEFEVERRIAKAFLSGSGIDLVADVAEQQIAIALDIITVLTWASLTATGSYTASTNIASGANVSAASYGWHDAFHVARKAIRNKRKWDPTVAHMWFSDDVYKKLRASDEVASFAGRGFASGGAITDQTVAQFVADCIRIDPENVHFVDGTYLNASATLTEYATASWGLVIANGGMKTSCLKSVSTEASERGMISIRGGEYRVAGNVDVYAADVAFGVASQDPDAGYLSHTITV